MISPQNNKEGGGETMSKPVFSDLFTLSGRRNRKSFFFYSLLSWLILGVAWGIAVAGTATGSDGGSMLPFWVAVIVSVGFVISTWIVGAQRCRDFGWTGWSILITLIPVVGWIFPFAMLFVPGTPGPNRYGPDPLAS
jgi:uncharacterized membrane protein YhaH (DUF805 family)